MAKWAMHWGEVIDDDDGDDEPTPCQCLCGCAEPAVVAVDSIRVCGACEPSARDPGGGVVCGRMTDGFRRCHDCGEAIAWGPIETGAPGVGSHIRGRCACARWTNREAGGGWDQYLYRPNGDDGEGAE